MKSARGSFSPIIDDLEGATCHLPVIFLSHGRQGVPGEPPTGVGGQREGGPPGMFQKKKTVFKVSQKRAEECFRRPQKTHGEARWKVVREKFIGNLAPGAGEGSLFAGHSPTKYSEVLSHILSKDSISSLLSPRAD